ncbi:MAG: dihydrodipicolinate synthase family protein [Pirellulaceae bacterium]|nr:dihydrodipicolinate synthase family protein [Pirellulaceae bacterium]
MTHTRLQRQQSLFPNGIPKLWCPTLTHFAGARQFDVPRIEHHLRSLAPIVHGILVPGSTGEGWEMSDEEIARLLKIVLPIAEDCGVRVLIGILKTQTGDVLAAIDALASQIGHPACVGITVCPAEGSHLTQDQLLGGLRSVLSLDIPTAIYQLPQVTQNEMSAGTVAALASEFPNFILFKDTSGEDRVAQSGADLQGVFMVRGSERGGYAQWLRSAGGAYDGFLLSTANCFAMQLQQIIDACEAGQQAAAQHISADLAQAVSAAFAIAEKFSVGNAFTNANKLINHLQFHGQAYRQAAAPILYSGATLPMEFIESIAAIEQLKPHLPS